MSLDHVASAVEKPQLSRSHQHLQGLKGHKLPHKTAFRKLRKVIHAPSITAHTNGKRLS